MYVNGRDRGSIAFRNPLPDGLVSPPDLPRYGIYVYMIIPGGDDNRVYVGVTGNLRARWSNHKSNGYGHAGEAKKEWLEALIADEKQGVHCYPVALVPNRKVGKVLECAISKMLPKAGLRRMNRDKWGDDVKSSATALIQGCDSVPIFSFIVAATSILVSDLEWDKRRNYVLKTIELVDAAVNKDVAFDFANY